MDSETTNCLKIVLVIVLAYITFFWVIYPRMTPQSTPETENFAEESKVQNVENNKVSPETQAPPASPASPAMNPMDNMDITMAPISDDISGVDEVPDNYYLLDDGANGMMSIRNNLCSPSCCSDQYPTSFKLRPDENVCASKGNFVPSSYMCNNSYQDSGCLCMTKEQSNFLSTRGGNGGELF